MANRRHGSDPAVRQDRTADLQDNTAELIGWELTRRKNLARYGTVTRLRTMMSDGIEREVIHAQALARTKAPTRSVDLTIGTAPPLGAGPDGMIMHFLLKSMEAGIDGVAFGPERSRSDLKLGPDDRALIASRLSLPKSAHAAHIIADRLGAEQGVDLSHMLWNGISLGAVKGIAFSTLAPTYQRTMVYSHFVAPVCPNPEPVASKRDVRRFMLGELGAMFRSTTELMMSDLMNRRPHVHADVARMIGPGLMSRYANSTPRDSVTRTFAEAWRIAVVSGDAGTMANRLPPDRLTTFELFDRDQGSPPDAWREKLDRQISAGRTCVVLFRGRHSDAARLSFQRRRARAIADIIDQVNSGIPVAELAHPYQRGHAA
jgi:hypothetical protein